jgi:NitT/TauT family transport system substrate-binding protein
MGRTIGLLRVAAAAAAFLAGTVVNQPVMAETGTVRLAKQFGLASLTFMVMEHEKLYEKHLVSAGLPDTKVSWERFSGGAAMNDAILAGALDFAAAGVVPLSVLWSKTRGSALEVKGVTGLNMMPMYLISRDPAIKSVRDYTARNRISVPAVKVSMQAIALQMAAAQAYGDNSYAKLDAWTVTSPGPEAMVSFMAGKGEIDSVFTSAPYAQMLLAAPGMHTVINSFDLAGPHDINMVYTTSKFRTDNPKTYAAFLDAFQEATDFINADKRRAAGIYLKLNREPVTVDQMQAILEDPQVASTMTPQGVMKFTNFAYKIGTLKVRLKSWKEMFFPEIANLPGN